MPASFSFWMLFLSSSRQPVRGYSDPQSMAVSFRLACVWYGLSFSALPAFYQHKPQGWVISCMKAPQLLPPPASAYGPPLSLSFATDLSVSERASGAIGRMRPLSLPWRVLFKLREDVGCVTLTLRHTPSSVPDYFQKCIVSDELAVIFHVRSQSM